MKLVREIEELIRNKIEYHNKNSLTSHLKTVFLFQRGLSGEVESGKFELWRYSYWLGIFYPVFYGTIDHGEGSVDIKIHSKLNILGTIIVLITTVGFIYLVTNMVLDGDPHPTYLWRRVLLGLIFIAVSYATFGYLVLRQHRIERKEIKNECQQWVKCISS
jgi:hypothetical protein